MSNAHKKKGYKKIIIGCSIGLVVLLALFAILRPKGAQYDEETAKTGNITTYYSFSGTIESKNHQNLMSDKTMQIKEIKVKEGDKVKKDDVLLVTTRDEEIKSDIDGEVSTLYVEQDQSVMAGAKLLDIVDYDNLKISVKVDEYDLPSIAVDKDVTVHINALDKDITGKIASISKEASVTNGVSYFTADIDLAQDSSLRVGMSTEAKLVNQSVQNAVTISMKSVQFDSANKPYVILKDEKGKPAKQEIETGINDGTTVEIKSGLKTGDTVLIPKDNSVKMFGFRQGQKTSSSSGGNAA